MGPIVPTVNNACELRPLRAWHRRNEAAGRSTSSRTWCASCTADDRPMWGRRAAVCMELGGLMLPEREVRGKCEGISLGLVVEGDHAHGTVGVGVLAVWRASSATRACTSVRSRAAVAWSRASRADSVPTVLVTCSRAPSRAPSVSCLRRRTAASARRVSVAAATRAPPANMSPSALAILLTAAALRQMVLAMWLRDLPRRAGGALRRGDGRR